MTTVTTLAVPLRQGGDGTLRIGSTRVTLDTVISVFNQGATPEAIVQRFPTLELADVYAVATYYLQNRPEVDAYLRRRLQQADALRQEIEATLNTRPLRERLIARRAVVANPNGTKCNSHA
jgi:uncharacterized protein (DUF433 family)